MLAADRDRLPPEVGAAIERLDELVDAFECDPDERIREMATELLQSVDLIHRAGLSRLAALLGRLDEATRRAALADPAVRLLFELYDLLPQELVPPPGAFVPLEEVEVISEPRRSWVTAARLADLPPDGVLSVMLGETRVLLARLGERVVAYEDASGASPLPVGFGHREGEVVVCPWHGCRFDLASGRRLDAAGEPLTSLPVEVVGDEVRVKVAARPAVTTLGAEASW
jgi:nitrite reductase/ring-hydroxylating ferredoxin subunit